MISPTPVPQDLTEESKAVIRGLKNSTRSAAISLGDHLATVASNGGEQKEESFLATEAELMADIASQVAADLRQESAEEKASSATSAEENNIGKNDLEEKALEEPLSQSELAKTIGDGGSIEEVVSVQMSTFEKEDLDGILSHLSRKVIGSPLLMETSYEVIGVKSPAQIYVRVSGYLPEDWSFSK